MKKTCLHCRTEFNAPGRRSKFCGQPCFQRSKMTDANGYARFWDQVEKTPSCWLWKGWVTSAGYGETSVGGRRITVHRLSYTLANGPIPKGKLIMHTCDVPLCVRPDHLRIGTDAENHADMVRKGRHTVGVATKRAKLTDELVRQIRAEFKQEKRPGTRSFTNATVLAEKYGVARNTIINAAKGMFWRHVK